MQRALARVGLFGLFTCSLAACGGPPGDVVDYTRDSVNTTEQALQATLPKFSICNSPTFAGEAAQGFTHETNTWWARARVRHTAQDVVATPGMLVGLGGRFGYGAMVHPLRDEDIAVHINDCTAWQDLGVAATDDAGGAAVPYTAARPGRFDVVSTVLGDGSEVQGHLHTLPEGTHLVVFDIDGTLTVSDAEFMHQLRDNNYTPQAYAQAVAATQAWAKRGYMVVYLSGRPRSTLDMTRSWLQDQGFAPGLLHITNQVTEAVPTREGVGAFKLNYLRELQDMGFEIDYAYGNQTTDFGAYLGAGISAEHVFSVGPKAGMDATQPLPEGYADNLAFIADAPAAAQPFVP